eukprot:6663836-Prymnesium_polylepis.1
MAAALHASSAPFRAHVATCSRLLAAMPLWRGPPLGAVLYGAAAASPTAEPAAAGGAEAALESP